MSTVDEKEKHFYTHALSECNKNRETTGCLPIVLLVNTAESNTADVYEPRAKD